MNQDGSVDGQEDQSSVSLVVHLKTLSQLHSLYSVEYEQLSENYEERSGLDVELFQYLL
jgi:hypothetical protein